MWNEFKEWLSDYLRYFLLGFAILGCLGILFGGFKLYQALSQSGSNADSPVVVNMTEDSGKLSNNETEASSEADTAKLVETTVAEQTPAETQVPAEIQTPAQTQAPAETQAPVETQAPAETQTTPETVAVDALTTEVQETQPDTISSYSAGLLGIHVSELEAAAEAESETQPAAQEVSNGSKMVLTDTVNFRQKPSYDGAVIEVLSSGTEVTYLEDAQGWTKIQADGMTGYVGSGYLKAE